jgi:hypothetical protein
MPVPDPDDGGVRDGVFRNEYFNLSYHLPPEWAGGVAGPDPSVSGFYVPHTFVPAGELTGTSRWRCKMSFFAAKPFDDAMAMAEKNSVKQCPASEECR